ncbi:MAG: hypothetical protein B7Y40_04855 [Gammaproteobacteria bacterium 28-57-27]|nr:MAG: hypothetical protein B7Y40_04855 [Gammaproteobacteria bacterium 28-57-27]
MFMAVAYRFVDRVSVCARRAEFIMQFSCRFECVRNQWVGAHPIHKKCKRARILAPRQVLNKAKDLKLLYWLDFMGLSS